jgi:hypothetical protein
MLPGEKATVSVDCTTVPTVVKPGAEAVIVADPNAIPFTFGVPTGVVAPLAIRTAPVTLTVVWSLLCSVTKIPPGGAGAPRLIGNAADPPTGTISVAGKTIPPAVAAGAMLSAKLAVAVSGGELESLTLKVSGRFVAVAVGVPLIRPVEALSFNPFGSVPETTDHVYGDVPPFTLNGCEYGVPT